MFVLLSCTERYPLRNLATLMFLCCGKQKQKESTDIRKKSSNFFSHYSSVLCRGQLRKKIKYLKLKASPPIIAKKIFCPSFR